MKRWNHLLSRTVLLLMCGTFVLIAINPLVRHSIVRSGQAITGADVEVDSVRADIMHSTIHVQGFRAADPQRASRNLFEIGDIKLHLDRNALERRRIVVEQAEVVNLQLDTIRKNDGVLTEQHSRDYLEAHSKRFAKLGLKWIKSASACLEQQESKPHKSSQQLADELLSKWPGELERIEQQALALNDRLHSLNSEIESANGNPLRNSTTYEEAVVDLSAISQQMVDVRGEMDRAEQQILMDQDAIASARSNDERNATTASNVQPIDADALSEYMLGEEVSQRVVTLVNWLRWGRQFLPVLSKQTAESSSRGRDVHFVGLKPQPAIEIRNLILRGSRHGTNNPFEFEGQLRGLTSEPALQKSPTEVTVQTTSGTPCLIEAQLTGSGLGAQDHVHVNCPSLVMGPRTLGNAKQLAIDVAPGNAHLWVDLTTEGETLKGDLLLKQGKVTLASHIDNEFQCSAAAGVFARSLERIKTIELAVSVSGTLDHPTWTLRSNLGPQLSAHLDTALAEQLLVRSRTDLQQLRQDIDQRIQALAQQVATKRASIIDLLSTGSEHADQLRENLASRMQQYR